MTARLPRLLPRGLAGRFALLLVAALLAVNLVALALLSVERERLGREFAEGREIGRLVTLVPLIEAVPSDERTRIADLASDRRTRLSIDSEPRLLSAARDGAAAATARRILFDLGVQPADLRAEASPAHGPGQGEIGLSVLFQKGGEPSQWLNIAARTGPPTLRGGPAPRVPTLLVSLIAVLGAGMLFIRLLTRPLADLAAAARAAGRGDRSVRVPETGARELRETAEAFNDMQAHIARFDAERLRTLAAVGHDLRTPLTSLRIRAEMLDDPERDAIIRTLDEMTVMADGLVAYARGQGDAEPIAPVDLQALVTRLAAERGAEIIAAAPLTVRGRPVALSRALGNLIDNALRYGTKARIRLEEHDDQALVTVEDDGPGIPPERIETMFEPFVRGEASRSLETGGAGLGLAIARTIFRAHGGEITLCNGPGGGLRATAMLPLGPTS